ncbi:MAG: dihydrodipicolinate synthase family protein [Clostridia bacterium]|nr:dihydrodipicolinate synthase family protein [Clostridia bacterium]
MKFAGVIPALVTPLTETEELNAPVLEQLLEHLLAQGADGFYIGGATGEGLALRREVREALTSESIRMIRHRVPTIVHIAATDFSLAVELAKQAERAGADAISAIPPLFFGYDEGEVFEYYKALAGVVHIPLMIYYNPSAGYRFTAESAARLFVVDNITAIKWTASSFDEIARLKEMTHGEMNVLNGPDEMLLQGLSAGADGGIGTAYNIILPRIRRVYESFCKGDLPAAQKAQRECLGIIKVLCADGLIPSLKAAMEQTGFAVGNAHFPMKRFSEEQKGELMYRLRQAGL